MKATLPLLLLLLLQLCSTFKLPSFSPPKLHIPKAALPILLLPSLLLPLPTIATDSGFAEYSKDKTLPPADPICFMTKCKSQTIALGFSPPSIAGIKCLGECKGEQICAASCFASYGSPVLYDFLNCALEENKCIPLTADINAGVTKDPSPPPVVDGRAAPGWSKAPNFTPELLAGKWVKVAGISDIYDMFDCQTNTITPTNANDPNSDLTMDLTLRIDNPTGGGFFTQRLSESITLTPGADTAMKTSGQMYGLSFREDWYVPVIKDDHAIVRYRGKTLQGDYEGGFVFARDKSFLGNEKNTAVVQKEWKELTGRDYEKEFKAIDNQCPATVGGKGEQVKRDSDKEATVEEWKDLIFGEGGIGDWIKPGWRGEYKS